MPDPVRRLSVPPLAGLEGQGCRSLGGGGIAVWLSHSLPPRSSTVRGSDPHAFLPSLVHQRGGAEGGHSGSDSRECIGACSASFLRILQPSSRRVEGLGVLETSHRSLDPQSFCGCVTLSDGDYPVGSPVCSSGRLDGLHQPQGSVLAGPCPSGLSSLPSVCGTRQSVPVHYSLI